MASSSLLLQQKILDLVKKREYPKTCCPSEVARALSSQELKDLDCKDWREAMDIIRQASYQLYHDGEIQVTQKGEKVDLERLNEIKGPIRLRMPG